MQPTQTLPVIPLRNAVLFPGVSFPIAAGRPGTLHAIETAMKSPDQLVFAITQRQDVEAVTPELLHTVGTIASIGPIQRGVGGARLLLQGKTRGIAMRIQEKDGRLEAVVVEAAEMPPLDAGDTAFVALLKELKERSAELAKKLGLPDEAIANVLSEADEPGKLADLVAGYIDIPTAERQLLLETLSVEDRVRRTLVHVQRQVDVLDAQEEIKSKVQEELGDRQREMFLRQQLKAIQKELGEGEDGDDDLKGLKEKLDALVLTEDVRKEIDREWKKLQRLSRESMEAQVLRNYLELVAELPWSVRSDEHLDVVEAERILDEDHYALKDVKDRILEFLAVRQLLGRRTAEAAAEPLEGAKTEAAVEGATAPASALPPHAEPPKVDGARPVESKSLPNRGRILLFAGPPGVGKTSIAKSIARALGRKYVRISFGGARDEADIRGHRRTYVGAMPGRIVQGMRQAGTKNPVFLLDEVDKLGVSMQGDPASALLEVLDPAQNDSFTDHYLNVPFDLSEVLFIATANFVQSIPGPLLDRLEVIEFSGYTEREKTLIARNYLLPRQLGENGLNPGQLEVTDAALAEIISSYTREAGVRQLERELGKLGRKVARRIAAGEIEKAAVDAPDVAPILGRKKIQPEKIVHEDQVGVATGMYYTPAGGDIMFIEAALMRGKGEVLLTGQLGDVMKESARAAWTFARSHAPLLGIDDTAFERDLHIHVPAGAIPKDGPSAGVAMASAIVSALSKRTCRRDVAMTGEVTLSGRVLPIGGVKEKLLGAVRAGIRTVVLPKENVADLEDLPQDVRDGLEIVPVQDLSEALAVSLRGRVKDGQLLFTDEAAGSGKDAPAAH
ncbi:MAG: endopeptidase La [Holophagales bacterium]|nr:endopeptidase La [Holophagales bacterium]